MLGKQILLMDTSNYRKKEGRKEGRKEGGREGEREKERKKEGRQGGKSEKETRITAKHQDDSKKQLYFYPKITCRTLALVVWR